MIYFSSSKQWARELFGGSDLGDPRRSRRLIDYAARQADDPAGSTHKACRGEAAAVEGAYRLMRNSAVVPKAMEEGPFDWVAKQCQGRSLVLAVMDTTALVFPHAAAEELGDLGGGRGFVVHSTLMVDGETGEVIGLLDQQRWARDDARPSRQERSYEEKESYKWQAGTEQIRTRLTTMSNVVCVGDREADLHEFFRYQQENGHRFVVRGRRVRIRGGHLSDRIESFPVLGRHEVHLSQRGAQRATLKSPAREARREQWVQTEIRSGTATLAWSTMIPKARRVPVTVNVIHVRELNATEEKPLEWTLFTSEPAASLEEAIAVVRIYEKRWLIEEFHKSWKQGCKIEKRRLQSADSLERIAIVTAHVAVRLLQLRALAQERPSETCEKLFTRAEWQCLWLTANPSKRMPKKPPTMHWAYYAIARLGGWTDTKKTGRVGWSTLWDGWTILQERVAGWLLAQKLAKRAGTM